MTAGVSVLALVLLGAIFATLAVLVVRDAGVPGRDVAWLAGGVIPPHAQAEVYRAYLRRHNVSRLVGGVLGLLLCLVVGLRWNGGGMDGWSLSLSVGGPLVGNLLVWWLAGVVLGTLSAESYRLSRRSAVRRATLDARPRPPLPRVTWAARIIGALAIAGGAVGIIVQRDAAGLGGPVLAALLVGLAEVTQRAITDRPRPATQPALTVDGRLRAFAGTSVAWLGLAGAVLGFSSAATAWTAWLTGPGAGLGPGWQTALTAASIPVSLGCFALVLVAIVRSRVRPPRGWAPAILTARQAAPPIAFVTERPA